MLFEKCQDRKEVFIDTLLPKALYNFIVYKCVEKQFFLLEFYTAVVQRSFFFVIVYVEMIDFIHETGWFLDVVYETLLTLWHKFVLLYTCVRWSGVYCLKCICLYILTWPGTHALHKVQGSYMVCIFLSSSTFRRQQHWPPCEVDPVTLLEYAASENSFLSLPCFIRETWLISLNRHLFCH